MFLGYSQAQIIHSETRKISARVQHGMSFPQYSHILPNKDHHIRISQISGEFECFTDDSDSQGGG